MKRFFKAVVSEGSDKGKVILRSTSRSYTHMWFTVVSKEADPANLYYKKYTLGQLWVHGFSGSRDLAMKAAQSDVSRVANWHGKNVGLAISGHIVPVQEITSAEYRAEQKALKNK